MEGTRILRNSQIIILGVCIALATVASSVILSRGFMSLMRFQKELISVTGSAQQIITSDLAVWTIEFSRRGAEPAAAYRALDADLARVKTYLATKGVPDDELSVAQVVTATLFRKNAEGYDTNEVEGHRLSRRVTVRSPDVRSARMGVFQITPPTSTDVSDYGVNDTSSLEKKVMAVVSASFAIE